MLNINKMIQHSFAIKYQGTIIKHAIKLWCIKNFCEWKAIVRITVSGAKVHNKHFYSYNFLTNMKILD